MTIGRPREFDPGAALEAAMHLFWEKGYEATSKRELMEATGISSQSLYNTFGGKRELYTRAIKHYMETRYGGLQTLLARDGSPLENLREMVRWWGGAGPGKELEKGCLLCNSMVEFGRSEDAELIEFLRQQIQRLETVIRQTLERAREAGELDPAVDPRALAASLACASQGIALMRRVGVPRRMVKDITDEALRRLASVSSPG